MNIVNGKSPNHFNGRNGHIPSIIVCHITQGGFGGAVSWLSNKESQASAHFVVARDGRVTQLVDLKDGAWCNGTSTDSTSKVYYEKALSPLIQSEKTNANYYTIGIEHEGFYESTHGVLTDIQKDVTIELIKHIKSEIKRIYDVDFKLDREHIIGHYQVNPITKPHCPGELYPFDDIIRELNSKKEDDNELIDKTDILIDGKKYNVNRILKNGHNYIELAEFQKAGYKIEYDKNSKLPSISK